MAASSEAPSRDPLTRALRTLREPSYVAMRVVMGLLFGFHGLQKIFHVLFSYPIEVGSQAWIGGLIELVTGVTIAAGAFTVWSAFLASGTMAVAYVQFHWRLRLGTQLLPAINQGEAALINAFVFLYIACRGPGRASVDGLLARRR